MSQNIQAGGNFIVFGPDANCTLALCPVEWSVYSYRPSLPSNITFLVLFSICGLIHAYLGFRWRTIPFAVSMAIGCISELLGYVGRIMMYNNPFAFSAFIMQIVLITSGPVYYTAAIYVTLSRTIVFLDPSLTRFKPALIYWIFIPIDIVCLVLQAAGGALSTVSSGTSQSGTDLALTGLSLQVASLFMFGVLFVDYVVRYVHHHSLASLSRRMKVFLGFLGAATVLIEARCFYRAYELSQGYRHSDLTTDEGLFIGLEGVLVLVAAYLLCIGNPGLIFGRNKQAAPTMATEQSAGSDGTADRENKVTV